MSAASRQLIAQAHFRARSVAGARDPQLRAALVRRVLFDLRRALRSDLPIITAPTRS